MRRAILFSVMRILIQIALVILLTGCASSFQPVYTSAEGDYYLEESSSVNSYYGAGSVHYADVGFNPWWVDPYNPLRYGYYSPYFYPHYFSVWYPPVYSPYYRYFGYYPGYYPNWCPPYLARRAHQSSRVVAPQVNGLTAVSRSDIWRSQDNGSLNRMVKSGQGGSYKPYESARSIKSTRSALPKPSASYSTRGSRQSVGSSIRAPRTTSIRRSQKGSSGSSRRSKQ